MISDSCVYLIFKSTGNSSPIILTYSNIKFFRAINIYNWKRTRKIGERIYPNIGYCIQ